MQETTKVKVAAAATALFLGGIAATGLALRADETDSSGMAVARPEVIREQNVKTVPATAAGVGYGAPPAASALPAPVTSPVPVSSRTSPLGSGDDDDDGRDREEHGEDEEDDE